MPLGSATAGLLNGIQTAYKSAVDNGAENENAFGTQNSLARDMSSAIDTYYSQALVTTSVIIDSGQQDSVGGSTQVDGTGSGTGSLTTLDPVTLTHSLYNAYKSAATTGEESDPIQQLAQDVGDAVYKYMISPTVITAVMANGGQVTNASAGTANPIGTVASPGIGTAEGEVSFESDDVSVLKSDVETAYNTAKTNGKAGLSLEALATDIHAAIHRFALTAIVKTDVTVVPGQVVAGYMVLVGVAPAPLPAVTLVGSGTGEGTIS
jgi:hypothetical protein